MLAVPILIQVFLNSGLAYVLNRRLGVAHRVAGLPSLIGASNFSSWQLRPPSACSVFNLVLRWRRSLAREENDLWTEVRVQVERMD